MVPGVLRLPNGTGTAAKKKATLLRKKIVGFFVVVSCIDTPV